MLEQINKLLEYLEEKMSNRQHGFVTKTPCQTSLTSFYNRKVALGDKEKMSYVLTSVRVLTLIHCFEKEDKELWPDKSTLRVRQYKLGWNIIHCQKEKVGLVRFHTADLMFLLGPT